MVPLRTGNVDAKRWVREKRNIQEDLKKFLGQEIQELGYIALMTDSDNMEVETVSYYGNIFFSEK